MNIMTTLFIGRLLNEGMNVRVTPSPEGARHLKAELDGQVVPVVLYDGGPAMVGRAGNTVETTTVEEAVEEVIDQII